MAANTGDKQMFTFRITKILGALALATLTFASAADAGTRGTGLMGPGYRVSPPTPPVATMQGYQQLQTLPQMQLQQVPAGRIHRACPDNSFWNGWKCTPLFGGVRIGR